MSAAKTSRKTAAPAEVAQLNIKVPPAFKAAIASDAKKAGRTLAAEVVHRCTVKERLRADLAAGRVPATDAVEPAAEPAASSQADRLAPPASYIPPELADEAIALAYETYDTCTQEHADVVIPNRLGQRLKAFVQRWPRAAA